MSLEAIEKADLILQLVSHDGWKLVEKYMQERIADNKDRLMTCTSWDDVIKHRNRADALESVFVFMQGLVDEVQKQDTD